MRSQKFIFYSLAALLAVLVFMVYYDIWAYGASDLLRPWYYDMIEHFIGGVIVAGLFLHYFHPVVPKNIFLAILFTASFVALVALTWEVFEFSANVLGNSPQNGLADTLSDMILGVSGAIVGSAFIRGKILK